MRSDPNVLAGSCMPAHRPSLYTPVHSAAPSSYAHVVEASNLAAMIQTVVTSLSCMTATFMLFLIGGTVELAVESVVEAFRGLRDRVLSFLRGGTDKCSQPSEAAPSNFSRRLVWTVGWFTLFSTPLIVVIVLRIVSASAAPRYYVWLGSDTAATSMLVTFCIITALHVAVFTVGVVLGLRRSCLLQMLDHRMPGSRDSHSVKFCGNKVDLISGQPKYAAMGIFHFMQVDEDEIRQRMSRGVDAIIEEIHACGTEVDKECLDYVLHQKVWTS